jgi:hypothetical protein
MFSKRLGWIPTDVDAAGPEGGVGVGGSDCGSGRSPDVVSDGVSTFGVVYVLRGPNGGVGSAGWFSLP